MLILKKYKELLFLAVLICLFVFIRSLNFEYHLNFSLDQGQHAIDVLKIWETKNFIFLIGNPLTSIRLGTHFLFQGPAYYYMLLPIMALVKFDPIKSSYLFMLFCSITLIPLYYGVKKLINRDAAIATVIIYALFPYFINYTRFHWNPNYQLSLIPFVILLMGLYKEKKDVKYFWGISIMLGVLFQFHYQFIWVVLGIFIYYFVLQKESIKKFYVFVVGGLIGVSPLILNELVHDFYNIRTLILFITNRDQVSVAGGVLTSPHYWVGISTFILVAFFGLLRKLTSGWKFNKKITPISKYKTILFVFFGFALFAWSFSLYSPKPEKSYWLNEVNHWNYPGEYKAYEIIKSQNLENYNVANFVYYDTLATVVKFLLMRDGVPIEHQDYYNNKYLFALNRANGDFSWITSYEYTTFNPRKLLKVWKLNDSYNLYLFERVGATSL